MDVRADRICSGCVVLSDPHSSCDVPLRLVNSVPLLLTEMGPKQASAPLLGTAALLRTEWLLP